MSIILRALKKLEQDKASHKPEPADLGLEFLESAPPAPRRSLLRSMLMVGLLVACGSTATYLFMTRAEKAPAPAPPQARQAVIKPATSLPTPVQLPANRSSASSPSAGPSPRQQAEQLPESAPLAPKTPRTSAKTQPESTDTRTPDAKQREPQAAKAPRSQLQDSSLPKLTVNGIALSDGDKRKAIVNGMAVSVGSTIEGARVEDIQGHRVRFSCNGKTFEIAVGNTGP